MYVFLGDYPKDDVPRAEYIRLDKHDTYDVSTTISYIIVPLLKQFRATTHGAPLADVTRSSLPNHILKEIAFLLELDPSIDPCFYAWDWILGEMIYGFESHRAEDDSSYMCSLHENERQQNGLMLFAKYFKHLWY